MAGEVVDVGAEASKWKKGDRVCANFSPDHVYGEPGPETRKSAFGGPSHGVLTEYRTFPAHSLVHFPSHLTYEEASTLPCSTLTAYNALHGPVPVKAGDFVLVLGTGGVSIAALQIAVASGATVIATSSSDEKLKTASKLGAKLVLNYKKNPDWAEDVLKFTNGAGVNHVIEVGGYGTLDQSFKSVKSGGWIHIIGLVAQAPSNVDIVIQAITNSVYLRGLQVGSVEKFKDLNRLIVANPNVTRPVVDKVFPWSEAKNAFAYLESQAHVGKVVIKVAQDKERS